VSLFTPIIKRYAKLKAVRTPFEFQVIIPTGVCQVVSCSDPRISDPLPIGWALFSVDKDHEYRSCTIWDVYVRPQYRKRGYGRAIIALLQDTHDEVFTQWEQDQINSAGVQLCIHTGFNIQKKLFQKDVGTLIWKKGQKKKK
jgi:GNAT superfamily N-acetyltransferase